MQPGGSLLRSCDWGWLVVASSPAEVYHPGTAIADHRDIEEAVTRMTHAGRVTSVDDGRSMISDRQICI